MTFFPVFFCSHVVDNDLQSVQMNASVLIQNRTDLCINIYFLFALLEKVLTINNHNLVHKNLEQRQNVCTNFKTLFAFPSQ